MKPSPRLLIALVALLSAWLIYLGWLAFTRPLQAPGYPLVVSRPQILASELDVIGEIEELAPEDKPTRVKVVEVLAAPEGDATKAGDVLEVNNLRDCHPVQRGKVSETPAPKDCPGPGKYLMPLRKIPAAPGKYDVTPVPQSPGFRPELLVRRVYPDGAEVRAQYGRITKP
jgi:hypothetical protein